MKHLIFVFLFWVAVPDTAKPQSTVDTTTQFFRNNVELIRYLNQRPTMTDLKNYYNQTDSSSRPYTIANVPTTSFVSTVDGSVLQLVYSGTGNLRLKGVSYNSSVPGVNYSGYRARGTNTAPSSLLTNDIATVLSAYPYGSTAFPINSRASVALRMAENSTDANMGMYIDFLLTRQGTNTINASRSRFYYDSIHLEQLSTTGVVRSTGGLLSSSQLTSNEVTTALGYTPADGATSGSKVNVADTANMLAPYAKGSAVALKVNISDTSAMLSPYTRKNKSKQDSTDLQLSIAARVRYSDTASMLSPYLRGSAPVTSTRALNSNFTISTTRPAFVVYTDSISVTNPLLSGSSKADVWLEYSLDAGTTWKQVCSNGNSSSVALTVTVAITNAQKGTLTGYIPANALVRLRSTSSGTASVAITNQTETIL